MARDAAGSGASQGGAPSTPARQVRWERQVEGYVRRFLEGEADLPPAVRQRAVATVADVIAAAVAASAVPEMRAVLRGLSLPLGPAALIGLERRTSVEWAALVNTTLGICEEVEEGHNLGGHVGVSTAMGALAAAEEAAEEAEAFSKGRAQGAALVDAVARAYEVAARVEYAIMAVRGQINQSTGWVIRDPHSTWTVLGATLAAALVRRWLSGGGAPLLDAFRAGLNLAVVSMWDPFAEGAAARNFTAGLNAQAGVAAARLAAAGMAGSEEAVLRVLGPARDLRGAEVFDGLFEGLGRDWWLLRSYFKVAPSCRYTHPPLEALERVRPQIRPEVVERIDVHTFAAATPMSHRRAVNRTSAKFSIPYVIARYLMRGSVGLDDFGPAALADEEVHRLAERVWVHQDAAIQQAFPERWLARVEVTHTDGSRVVAEPVDARGDWRNPAPEEELRRKWLQLLERRLSSDEARAVLATLLNLDGLQEVRQLTDRLLGMASGGRGRSTA